MKNLDELSINNARYLAATTISNAKSGHTGISLGATTILYSLYAYNLKYFSGQPDYFNRDRLVLCAGHASALYYTLLHMFGFDYSMQDLINYRKKGYKTKGHPSANPLNGVDASGGPLGQGIPMAVGMAIAEQKLAHKFNKDGLNIINHYTYCFAGDGSLMEGITSEASSLAGTLALNKLIVLYDSNNITIEGNTDIAFTEDVLLRYKAYGWNTLEVKDGNDVEQIVSAINMAKSQDKKPTIIKINTAIGYKTPYQGLNKIHGMALNEQDLDQTKQNLGIQLNKFEVDPKVKEYLQKIVAKKGAEILAETKVIEKYKNLYPNEFAELEKWLSNAYAKQVNYNKLQKTKLVDSTRNFGTTIVNDLAKQIPNLLVGSADLAPSTGLFIKDGGDYSKNNIDGRNIHFGVREHAMGAICNGIALHGGFKIMCSTFMVFSDYLRHAVRMSALMKLPVVYVFTHDSVGVGEDGATHQPVEFLSMYRDTPNLNTIRPATYQECKGAYKYALNSSLPTILSLTRQSVEDLSGITKQDISKGAYNVVENTNPDVVIIATGSELGICVSASQILKTKGISANVVSMPCTNLFDAENAKYKHLILKDDNIPKIFVEASSYSGAYKYVGLCGRAVLVNSFGYTAKGEELFKDFGYSVENICKIATKLVKK